MQLLSKEEMDKLVAKCLLLLGEQAKVWFIDDEVYNFSIIVDGMVVSYSINQQTLDVCKVANVQNLKKEAPIGRDQLSTELEALLKASEQTT